MSVRFLQIFFDVFSCNDRVILRRPIGGDTTCDRLDEDESERNLRREQRSHLHSHVIVSAEKERHGVTPDTTAVYCTVDSGFEDVVCEYVN